MPFQILASFRRTLLREVVYRIQMELDSRKNEAKADLKRQDITIEVGTRSKTSDVVLMP